MQKGIVIKSTGQWYNVLLDNGDKIECRIPGKFRLNGMKLTNPVAVGDLVEVEKESVGKAGVIKNIRSRENYVVRQSPRKKHFLHLIASNIDQAIIVVTILNPSLKWGFIDRCLLMMEPHDIPSIIVVNKADLLKEGDKELYEYVNAVYESIGYQTRLVSATTGEGIEELKNLLKDKTSLICGQSGVGKSTFIGAIEPSIDQRIGDISDYTGKGQHTTTFAEMFDLSFGGKIIDTPGIKTLGFNNLSQQDVAHNFREFFILSESCKFGDCTHQNEPKCAVKEALNEGAISEIRYSNYLNILKNIEEQNAWEMNKDL